MGYFASVVLRQSGAQVVGHANIKVFGILAFENVDVFHDIPLQLDAWREYTHQRACRGQPSLRNDMPSRSRRKSVYVEPVRRRPSGYGGTAFAHEGMPSRSRRSLRRLVEP